MQHHQQGSGAAVEDDWIIVDDNFFEPGWVWVDPDTEGLASPPSSPPPSPPGH
jgi:hypothetical protein